MGWARPPRAPTWPGIFSSICRSLVQSCSASPALVSASVAPAHIPTSVPGFSATVAATGGQCNTAGRFYRPACLSTAPFRSVTYYEADADIAGVERWTAGHTPGLGCSNLVEMCADHPALSYSSSPPPSVLLSPSTCTLPAPPRLSSLLFGNEAQFGSGGVAASGGDGLEPHEFSGGGINKAVSATRRFHEAENGLCDAADYVAGTTEPASSLTHCNTMDAKPVKDSNSANIRL